NAAFSAHGSAAICTGARRRGTPGMAGGLRPTLSARAMVKRNYVRDSELARPCHPAASGRTPRPSRGVVPPEPGSGPAECGCASFARRDRVSGEPPGCGRAIDTAGADKQPQSVSCVQFAGECVQGDGAAGGCGGSVSEIVEVSAQRGGCAL